MTVYRPFFQTNLFHLFVGILAPAGFGTAFCFLLQGEPFPGKLYLILSFPLFVAGGLFFFGVHCVWKITCDEEKGILYFRKTFRRVVMRVRDIKEVNVFRTFRGYDYRFKTATRQITVEEMDGMSDLMTYIRRVNPQLNTSSPDDHTVFL